MNDPDILVKAFKKSLAADLCRDRSAAKGA